VNSKEIVALLLIYYSLTLSCCSCRCLSSWCMCRYMSLRNDDYIYWFD